jgi:hypothetical protein
MPQKVLNLGQERLFFKEKVEWNFTKWGEDGERMTFERHRKTKGCKPYKLQPIVFTMVPGAGVEPAQPQGPRDFKSLI